MPGVLLRNAVTKELTGVYYAVDTPVWLLSHKAIEDWLIKTGDSPSSLEVAFLPKEFESGDGVVDLLNGDSFVDESRWLPVIKGRAQMPLSKIVSIIYALRNEDTDDPISHHYGVSGLAAQSQHRYERRRLRQLFIHPKGGGLSGWTVQEYNEAVKNSISDKSSWQLNLLVDEDEVFSQAYYWD